MKKCTQCGEEKPLSEYQNRAASKDGKTARCKHCLRKYDQERNATPARMERARQLAWGPNKELTIATKKKWKADNPKKYHAHNLVAAAIRKGTIVRGPCECCGAEKVVAHHDDYDKPLEIRWLCSIHHRAWHIEHGEAKNPR